MVKEEIHASPIFQEVAVLNFPFVFQYTHMLVFFYTDAIEISWKSTP